MEELCRIASEMKQLAEKKPFRISAYNLVCDDEMERCVTINSETVRLVFTLDEYPIAPHQIWHLSIIGKLSNDQLQEIVKVFYPTGGIFEVSQEELIRMGAQPKEIENHYQFCQIKV